MPEVQELRSTFTTVINDIEFHVDSGWTLQSEAIQRKRKLETNGYLTHEAQYVPPGPGHKVIYLVYKSKGRMIKGKRESIWD